MNPLRRVVLFALGVFFLVMSIQSWREGSVYVHSRFGESTTITAKEDRETFWVGVLGYAAMGAFAFYYVFRRKSDDDD
jgi:hypothetical protein